MRATRFLRGVNGRTSPAMTQRPMRAIAMTNRMSEEPRSTRRLYGRSKGKALRKHQAALVGICCPGLRSISRNRRPLRARDASRNRLWRRRTSNRGRDARRRMSDFIGCEPFVNGMAKLLARIEERGLTNIRLHQGDATDVLDWLPDASLSRGLSLLPRPLAKATPSQAPLRVARKSRPAGARHATRRGAALRDRHRRLRRLDLGAGARASGLSWKARSGARLARALGPAGRAPNMKPKPIAAGTQSGLSDLRPGPA